ncbi:dihydroxyacetone kinase subunit DhaK [Treponema primitia]|uniref:dihydroxyacetone kinase subunit DhaK n=1 Tax=Treponema primitia TaxID=88058 RepID=UPI00025555E8|nr:dihydroxyacetone kinase subunit DhaK [Treponema primitia]
MKKLLNSVENAVYEMGAGIALTHTDLVFNNRYKFLRKKTINKDKVSLVSGGGSGHEPAHAGYIGRGMLDAAVCGDVFASPSQVQVYQAIKDSAGTKGTLLIIKNYSGDIMNFQNAAFLAGLDGLKVDYIKVNDDIAVEDSLYTVGRRGVAGTVLVHKIAGAAAEAGGSLEEVKRLAQKAADNVRSLGFAFTSCTVPAKGTPTFSLVEDEMEYGIGIHGEPGIHREKIAKAEDLAKRMIPAIIKDLKLGKDGEVVLLVNGFGATPLMELYLFGYSALAELNTAGIKTYRMFTGNYMTSLDMAGSSITLLKLDDELKKLIDAKSDAPAFTVSGPAEPPRFTRAIPELEAGNVSYKVQTDSKYALIENNVITLQNIIYLIDKMSEVIIENEVPFCDMDAHGGDGDFGMSIAKGFRRLKVEWEDLLKKSKTIGEFLDACAVVIMEYCGGASGPIWGFAFKYAAKAAADAVTVDIQGFAKLFQAAVNGVQETGKRSFGRGAVVGDKTLVDALVPCADSWSESAKRGASFPEGFKQAAAAAVSGADKTKDIVAHMGRAENAGERSLGYPDAGAYALGLIFTEIAKSVQ